MAEIIIRVRPTGETTVEADGIVGSACSLHTRPYVEALGQQTGELPKGEMFQQADQEQQIHG